MTLGPSSGSSKPLVVDGRTAPASLQPNDLAPEGKEGMLNRCRDYLVLVG
jgi:hypothetical protein